MTSPAIPTPNELTIIINSYPTYHSTFIGTRAMLEAEIDIPKEFDWSEGFRELRWSEGKNNFWLHRQKPAGAKGPRSNYAQIDWWRLGWFLTDILHSTRRIQFKAKELEDEIYRHSDKGIAESRKECALYYAAVNDEKFQAFKSLVPGLIQPQRSRRAKTSLKF